MRVDVKHKATIDACIDEIVYMLHGRAMHFNISYNQTKLLNKTFIQSVYEFHEHTEDLAIKQLDNGLYFVYDKLSIGEIHIFTNDLLDCYTFNSKIREKKVAKFLLEIIDTTLIYFKIKSISFGNSNYYYDKNLKTYIEYNE